MDNNGAVASRHDYLPFGEEIGSGVGSRTTLKSFGQPDSVRQKYAGMETDDATGMDTTLWRKDDNVSGRWTSPDPYTGSMTTADPQSFNRYTYCDNDPVNELDPSGLIPNGYHGADSGWGGVEGYFWGTAGDLTGIRSFADAHIINGEQSHEDVASTRLTGIKVPGGEQASEDNSLDCFDPGDPLANETDSGQDPLSSLAMTGWKATYSSDGLLVWYTWVNDPKVHDVPNDYEYVDNRGRLIALYGGDNNNYHSWRIHDSIGLERENTNQNPPETFATAGGMIGMLTSQGYKEFGDVLHERAGMITKNFANPNSPTLHISISVFRSDVAPDGTFAPGAPMQWISQHWDHHSPIGQPIKHLWYDYL